MTELESAAHRFSAFAEQVLRPAVWPRRAALGISVFQCADAIPHREAVRREFSPVALGWRWGPTWSTAWFKLVGRVPSEFAGQRIALRFSSGTEALLWDNGVPRQGFDENHDAALLFEAARGGEEINLHVEAACNRPLGATLFWWDHAEARARWNEATPGRLEFCELAVLERDVWELWRTFDFARQLMILFADDTKRGKDLCDALRRAMLRVNDADVAASAPAATAILREALRGHGAESRARCYAVGHAHIDTAWLWPLRETRRKCLRTFASALGLMERFPDFRFLCSQAQHYAWIEEESPELFAKIAQRVRDGRWEPGGAMWIEPDCNVPSGESLVRQILHGTRYWDEKFGAWGKQRFLYLPDTFGFPAALPQIIRLGGLDTFITNKLAWNETNEFPHVSFLWRGLDGTEIVTHCTPGREYNATNTPAELLRGEKNAARLDRSRADVWLQPFGYGDGGGGPTDWMILNARLVTPCEGLSLVRLDSASAFCDELQRRRGELRAAGRDFPVWDGELYLERHRGTLTTQAFLKQANRRAEQGLRMAEWLAFAGPDAPDEKQAAAILGRLDRAWKRLLLNQFHDILPGSSIGEVYADARAQHKEIKQECRELIGESVAAWSARLDTRGQTEPLLVLNPASAPRSGVVSSEGRWHYAANVPALGAAILDRAAPPANREACRLEGRKLSNGILEVELDACGRIGGLRRAGVTRFANARRPDGAFAPLNQLVLYDDRPRFWEAWDIDAEYEEKAFLVNDENVRFEVVCNEPLRVALAVTRALGKSSRLTQRYVLNAGSPRLDIETQVDWREERRLLRALFPVDVRGRKATYAIQFGHIERPTHRNTPWDRAMFEVCAHEWMDLSEFGFGVALLNDCKYGHSCRDNVLGLSLLRSAKFPDEQADIGEHEFTYSLMIHDGDWRAAGVDREAEALNAPFLAQPLPAGRHGEIQKEWTPFVIRATGAAGVMISAVKRTEGGDGLILRLVETHGGCGEIKVDWNWPVVQVGSVDLLERPLADVPIHHDMKTRRTMFPIRPFQIVTLAARRGQ